MDEFFGLAVASDYRAPSAETTVDFRPATPASAAVDPEMLAELQADHVRLDELERRILDAGQPVHAPVVHRFVPGLYVREIEMPAGMLLTSRIHRTEHPYAVLSGQAFVLVAGEEPELLEAGFLGITKPMTRRALYIPGPEPCRWATFHPLSEEEEAARAAGASEADLLAAIERRIIGPHLHLDGADAHQEYREQLAGLGLPGPHDGPQALEKGSNE